MVNKDEKTKTYCVIVCLITCLLLHRNFGNSTILLTIPHSNAAVERIFFMIAKSNTKHRFSLDHNRSLNFNMLIFPNILSIVTVGN